MKQPTPPFQDFISAINAEIQCLRRISAIMKHTKFNNPPGVEEYRIKQHREATKRLATERKVFNTHYC